MGENSGIKGFFGGLLSNAAWEWIKAAGGGLMSSLASALLAYVRNRPVDWWGVLLLGIITTVVVGLILLRENRQRSSKLTPMQTELALTLPLTTLQVEAIKLACDLLEFADSIQEEPAIPEGTTANDWFVKGASKSTELWMDKVSANFEIKFKGKIDDLKPRFRAEGIVVDDLNEEIRGLEIRGRIRKLAIHCGCWRRKSELKRNREMAILEYLEGTHYETRIP